MVEKQDMAMGYAAMVGMQFALGMMPIHPGMPEATKTALGDAAIRQVAETLRVYESQIRADERKRLLSEQGAAMDELGKIGGGPNG